MYYVYELIDPRHATVFYVGKGKGSRHEQHVKEARKGVHSRKCHRIRAILEAGREVEYRIVQRFKGEAEAYEFEAQHIAAIGLENLTNVLPGGGGVRPEPESKGVQWPSTTANTIARALLFLAGGNRIRILGHDVTEAMEGLIDRVEKDWGRERFVSELAKEGIRITDG